MASIRRHTVSRGRSIGALGLILALVAFLTVGVSGADQHVGLGTADSFAVLAGQGVTNTGTTEVNGDLGTCPNDSVTGAPDVRGEIHAADAVCLQAQADLTLAYDDAAGRAPTTTYTVPTDLGGDRLTAGVYKSPSSFGITGTLTLDAEGDPDAVFIFQAASTLITATNSTVMLVDGAQACNVFWQVGSSATLEVGSTFVGTILALTSIEAKTNAEVEGRLLARNASVTLDSNVITVSACAPDTTTTVPDATTTTAADITTTVPDTTTTVPDATTTTVADTTTTTVSDTTTTVPDATTTTVADTTTTTTAPDTTTTTLPDTTTTVPDTTTTVPDATTTTVADTTTTVPDTTTTTSAPVTTITTVPAMTSTTVLPATTTTRPSTTVVQTGVQSTSTTTAVGAGTAAVSDDGGGKGTDIVETATSAETTQRLANTGSAVVWTAITGVLTTALGTVVLLMNNRRRAVKDS